MVMYLAWLTDTTLITGKRDSAGWEMCERRLPSSPHIARLAAFKGGIHRYAK